MIPKGEQWDVIAGLSGGELSTTSYAVMLAATARSHRSGVLRLARTPVEKKIVIIEGRPVECQSNLAHETFGRFLRSEGQLSGEDHTSALSESLSRGVPLGEVLVERELLSPHDVYKFLQKNLARKLLDGFTWERGEFEFRDDPAEVDRTVRINALQLILTGVLKLTPQAEISAGVEKMRTEPIGLDPRFESESGKLRLPGHAQRFVAALERTPRTLEELVPKVGLDAEEVDRIAYGLMLLGLLLPAGEISVPSAIDTGGTVVEAGKPSGEPVPTVSRVAEPEDEQALLLRQASIVEAYLSFQRKDSFAFLGLEETATVPEMDAAYLQAAETFAPWSLGSAAAGDFAEQAEILFLKSAQAYAELKNSESRGSLIYRRKVLRDEEASRRRPEFSIETDLLDSEEQFKKGLAFVERGELGKALELLEFAADCDPQNATYRSELAYRRQQFDAHRYQKQSLADLREAIRIDPKCGLASYYLGLMLAEGDDRAEAEELLRRSIKLMAPDRRPIEALKELAGTKKR